MFPIKDETPRVRFPFINYLIILVNVIIFYIQITAPNFEQFIFQHGFVARNFSLLDLDGYKSMISSMFLHGGFFHLISNMWFLHIFGDNVEDAMGHIPYLLFYIVGGMVAVFAQYFIAPQSAVPMIGASGAVSAVAGAYFVWYRRSHVKTLVALFVIWTVVDLPASVVLGYWFLTQIFAGVGSLASVDVNQGGVAFFAHIGGFVYGWFIAKSIGNKHRFSEHAVT